MGLLASSLVYSPKELRSARNLKVISYCRSLQEKNVMFIVKKQQLRKWAVSSDKELIRTTKIVLSIIITLRIAAL